MFSKTVENVQSDSHAKLLRNGISTMDEKKNTESYVKCVL